MKELSLAIFDLDGTIKIRDGIPHEIFAGIEHIQSQDITTTIMTGKGKDHLRRTLGANWDTLISQNSPVGLENGGRITNTSGTENIRYHALSPDEISAQITLLESGELPFLLYVPENPNQKAKVWLKNEREAALFSDTDYLHYDIFTAPITELHTQIRQDNPCMFVFQPYSAGFRAEIPRDINIVSNEGVLHMNAQGINKGSGVLDLASITGSTLNEIMIAGNDENDIPMFELPVNRRVLVGEYEGIMSMPDLTKVADVNGLGSYLSLLDNPEI